ncbi:MAG: 50S ribosomal protein L17 [Planctomycetes bacterium]|nr:50S ribosomal protein L17 [Planctomycetota bacterium]
MRHKLRGRKLGRNASHRKALFRNMAASLIRTVRPDEDDEHAPAVPGRIVTTLAKAKELRPYVEKLVTMARKAVPHQERAREFETTAERGSTQWREWRDSDQWNQWNQAIAPALALRRRAFDILRDNAAVDILFDELAERFESRPGGYTRIIRLPEVRLGDAGRKALLEFVGDPERDRVRTRRRAPVVMDEEEAEQTAPEATPAGEASAPPTAGEEPTGDKVTR